MEASSCLLLPSSCMHRYECLHTHTCTHLHIPHKYIKWKKCMTCNSREVRRPDRSLTRSLEARGTTHSVLKGGKEEWKANKHPMNNYFIKVLRLLTPRLSFGGCGLIGLKKARVWKGSLFVWLCCQPLTLIPAASYGVCWARPVEWRLSRFYLNWPPVERQF